MREFSTAPLASLDGYTNATDLLARRAREAPDHVAFDVADGAGWRQVTTAEYHDAVIATAKGLIARGIQVGDVVAVMAATRYEWAVVDLAVLYAGGIVVPIYDTASPNQVRAIAEDVRFRLAFYGDVRHEQTLRTSLDGTAAADLGLVSFTDGLEALRQEGNEIDDAFVEERRTAASPDDAMTFVYTSGTTGPPKGVVLTHRNFLGQVLNTAAAYGEVVNDRGNTVIFLPLAHVLARGVQMICLSSGMRIAHLADPAEVVSSLAALQPTFLVVVPRVLEKIQAVAGAKAAEKRLGGVWKAAVETAEEWGRRAEVGASVPLALKLRHALFDRMFYRRLRALVGGRLAFILSGGAALDGRLSLFFRGIGLPVIEGYGLTETTAPVSGNLPRNIRSGSVGFPLPGSSIRISDEGEILAKGVGVFSGYRNPKDNEGAFIDGYFRTGDLGELDSDGRIRLRGRLKEVVVTSTGKTVVPAAWERGVEENELVAHAVVVGEGRSYLTALIVLTGDAVREPPLEGDINVVDDAALRAAVQRSVDDSNALVSRAEQIKRFELITVDLESPDLITPTMKLKRAELLRRSDRAISSLYHS